MENAHGLIVDAAVVHASGTAEREAAIHLLAGPARRRCHGGDKAYDTHAWVADVRALGVMPHVAQKPHSAIDGRTTGDPDYAVSQRVRDASKRSLAG